MDLLTLGSIHLAQNKPDILRNLGLSFLISFRASDAEVILDKMASGLVLKSPNQLSWPNVWQILKEEMVGVNIHNLQCEICNEDGSACLYVFF